MNQEGKIKTMNQNNKFGAIEVGIGSMDEGANDSKLRIEWAGDVGSGVIQIEAGNEDNDYRTIISGNELDKELIREVFNKLLEESEFRYRLLDNRLF